VSAPVGSAIVVPETMAGPLAVAPMMTQLVEEGHANWVSEVTAAGSEASVVKVTLVLGVVAPHMTRGAEAVRPMRRHFVLDGQVSPFREVTVVPAGKASAFHVQLGAATPSPAVAVPATVSGPVAVVPVSRQKVEVAVDGQARAVTEVSVTEAGLGDTAVQPSP
jgi:hypothetical protein